MKTISLLGLFIATIYFVKNFFKMMKNDEVEYQTVSLLAFIDSMMFLFASIIIDSNTDKSSTIMAVIFLLTGYILQIDVAFFAEKRVRKNYDTYYAISVLEEAGISYDSFKKLSFDKQLQLLKNTPCKFGDMEGMLIEDEDDLAVFDCIMNNKRDNNRA